MKLHVDIETRAFVDLRKAGQYVYAAHPLTQIITVCFAIDDGPVKTWFPLQRSIPTDLLSALGDASCTLCAHNASFERILLTGPAGAVIGVPVAAIASLGRWNCTAARAAAMGLPRTLDGAAAALGLHAQKDREGAALMMRMCKPKPGSPIDAPSWFEDDARMARLGAYCAQDVAVERMIDEAIPNLSDVERLTWALTERMNDEGVRVDAALLLKVAFLVDEAERDINKRLAAATDGAVRRVSDHGALTRWLTMQGVDDAEETGVGKAALEALMARDDLPDLVREVVTMRREGGKSSASKYRALLNRMGDDHRVRGALVYCGAASTGRWSSRGAQLQNLPRANILRKATTVAALTRDILEDAPFGVLADLYGPPIVLASELLRPVFLAADGHWLARGDYSQIEARVNPWFAGDHRKLDAFRAYDEGTGPDLYKVAAGDIYGMSPEDISSDDPRRQIGKVCLSAKTKVLTQRGWLGIKAVTSGDLLWDGDRWVQHAGLVSQGVKSTICWAGLRLTPDHLVLAGNEWTTAQTVSSCASMTSRALARGSANLPLSATRQKTTARFLAFGSVVRAKAARPSFPKRTCATEKAQDATPALRSNPAYGVKIFSDTRTSSPISKRAGACSTASARALFDANQKGKAPLGKTTEDGAYACTRLGQKVSKAAGRFCLSWYLFLGMTRQKTRSTESIATAITRPATCASYPKARTCSTKGACAKCKCEYTAWRKTCAGSKKKTSFFGRYTRKEPVYDLADAGPNKRFTVLTNSGPVIVHNCELALGFQGGTRALQAMAKGYGVKIPHWERPADQAFDKREPAPNGTDEWIKEQWRDANPLIVQFWRDLNDAAVACLSSTPGGQHRVREGLWFKRTRAALAMRLPSGRSLIYWTPRLRETRMPWGGTRPAVVFRAEDAQTKRWGEHTGYGGLWCENAVQATARDLMADALLRLHAAGLRPRLTVHDEGICEPPQSRFPLADDAAAAVETIMRQTPAWATGLPVAAEASAGPRYLKG